MTRFLSLLLVHILLLLVHITTAKTLPLTTSSIRDNHHDHHDDDDDDDADYDDDDEDDDDDDDDDDWAGSKYVLVIYGLMAAAVLIAIVWKCWLDVKTRIKLRRRNDAASSTVSACSAPEQRSASAPLEVLDLPPAYAEDAPPSYWAVINRSSGQLNEVPVHKSSSEKTSREESKTTHIS